MTPKPHPALAEHCRAHRFSFSDRCQKRIVGLGPICQSCGHIATTVHFCQCIVTWGWGSPRVSLAPGSCGRQLSGRRQPFSPSLREPKSQRSAFAARFPTCARVNGTETAPAPFTIECRGRAEGPEAEAALSPASGSTSLLREWLQPRMQFPWGLKMAPRGEIPEVCESLVLIPSVPLLPSLPELDLNPPFLGVRDMTSHCPKRGFAIPLTLSA